MTVVKNNEEKKSFAERMKIARMKKKEEREKSDKVIQGKGVTKDEGADKELEGQQSKVKSKVKSKVDDKVESKTKSKVDGEVDDKVESTNDSKIDLEHLHSLILEMRNDIDFILTQI